MTSPAQSEPEQPVVEIPEPDPIIFSAGVDRFFPQQRTEIAEVSYEDTDSSDDELALIVDGRLIVFDEDDLGASPSWGSGTYYKENNGEIDALWSIRGPGYFDYLAIWGFSHSVVMPGADLSTEEPSDYESSSNVFFLGGIPTPASDMPISGTATYDGEVEAREWSRNAAGFSETHLTRYRGEFSMDARFGASGTQVTGEFSDFEVRAPGVETYSPIPGSISFSTTVSGSQLSESMSISDGGFVGYEMDVRAQFYGYGDDAALEVGGVFDGEHPSAGTVLYGWFAGSQ